MNGIDNWDPIGYSGGCYFAGHYDGDGHTITGAKSTGKVDERDKDDAIPMDVQQPAFSAGWLWGRLKICMWKTQTLRQPVREITAMWAVLQQLHLLHLSKLRCKEF